MRNLYIGNSYGKTKKSSGLKWKIYTFLLLVAVMIGAVIKFAGPTIAEKWINKKGEGAKGYAFSIRDVDISLSKGQIVLKDVKIFNPNTNTELVEAPNLTLQLNLADIILSHDKKITVYADKVDVTLSKDFASEMERIKTANQIEKKDLYLEAVDGKISQLNIIEKKDDQSRTVLELNEVNVKVKEVGVNSINKKTEFSVSSNIADGGKLNLTGKTHEENGSTPWSINGSLKHVPSNILNKIAGDKLPFSYYEESLNAEISAHSDHGKVKGEISPDIKKVNVIVEKPGVPTQSIKRILNDDLDFTLPFTLKDELTVQYSDTYSKLKSYRKYPVASDVSPEPVEVKSTKQAQQPAKKSFSFWPF